MTDKIRYIGVNDHQVDLFEGRYKVPKGMSYNSYLILDEKIAVMDSVDQHFGDVWIGNMEKELSGKTPDYLIVQHMEPDHSANIKRFADHFPTATIVASKQAFVMMNQFFGTDFADRRLEVGEGSELSLGEHVLHFVTAPMVHWPEVIMTYESTEKILFSADAFGKFGANDLTADDDWVEEARRYYIGIVGKYGVQVQAVLKKAAALDIQTICGLHGPILTSDLGKYIGYYDTWSSYRPETEGVCIAYTSAYGHTAEAAKKLYDLLKAQGTEVAIFDLARDDMDQAVAYAFKYSKLVLAGHTYNADIFPFMKTFLNLLMEHSFQKRTVAFIENGSWAPQAAKKMMAALEGAKELTLIEPAVTIKGSLNEAGEAALKELAGKL
jgi:flavorubredoxin